jgi:hypothetical protein
MLSLLAITSDATCPTHRVKRPWGVDKRDSREVTAQLLEHRKEKKRAGADERRQLNLEMRKRSTMGQTAQGHSKGKKKKSGK